MTGTTLDTGALIALESGTPFMRALVAGARENELRLTIPAGVLAQAWRASPRQARLGALLRSSIAEVVPLDRTTALAVGKLCATSGHPDVVDVSVALCARERGHPVVTSDPDELAAVAPELTLLPPT